jgi:hypothetical protein
MARTPTAFRQNTYWKPTTTWRSKQQKSPRSGGFSSVTRSLTGVDYSSYSLNTMGMGAVRQMGEGGQDVGMILEGGHGTSVVDTALLVYARGGKRATLLVE